MRDAMAEHGSVYAVDGDRLAALAPDLILTQAVCEVCAVPTANVHDVVRERGLGAEVVSLDAHTLGEILETVLAVGRAAGVSGRATEFVDGLEARLEAVGIAVAGAERPRVLALEWLDPPFAPGHWVPQMIELAGGENLLGTAGEPSREVGWDEIGGLDPDVLVVMPCGYGLEAARRDADAHGDHLLAAAPHAIETGHAFVVDASSYFNRSGPRVVTGVEVLAGLLHPDRVRTPDPGTVRAWRPAFSGS